ncbi:unnamed protein product [Cyprideis torosa]|uniref:Uncharacterized protein n=1 Tax=Cyprideis torosa TaxID=163714 RepID=A0A7R8WJQ8_9CRUS|nr:unnamed protein product [Cyprideis torosa]CAG0902296.1 unnamed protein product [Cyprideis torosa]
MSSQHMVSLDIVYSRASKIYHENDVLAGTLVVETTSDFKHEGIFLFAEGLVALTLSSKSFGILEAFYSAVKPVPILSVVQELVKPGKVCVGRTEFPFSLPLQSSKTFYETYHGVYINIQYSLRAEIRRGVLTKDLLRTVEFLVQERPLPSPEKPVGAPHSFTLSHESLKVLANSSGGDVVVPRFKITGKFSSLVCDIRKPLSGQVIVQECSVPIRSIEIQLFRVEICGCAEGYSKDVTEVQNIQIAEGDVQRGLPISTTMIFPRLFACPSISTPNFKIDFEISLVVILRDNYVISEKFPLQLYRA